MEHIIPAMDSAIIKEASTMSKLSPREFQQQLYNWFHEKGMMSDLKSHVKHQMINILRSTTARTTITKHTHSLPLHALNFIIAEHFIWHCCYYSFSIFSSEVDLLNILPDYFSNQFNARNSEQKKLDKKTTLNILELIGFPRDSNKSAEIVRCYLSNNNSLLTCIINVFSSTRDNNELDESAQPAQNEIVNNCDPNSQFQSQINTKNKESVLKLRETYELKLNEVKIEYDLATEELKRDLCLKEQQISDFHKLLPILQHKLSNISLQYKKIKNSVHTLKSEKKDLVEQLSIIKSNCSLQHCSDECKRFEILVRECEHENEKLKAEIDLLTDMTKKHKYQYQELKSLYSDIVKEIEVYKNKLNMMNGKLYSEINQDADDPLCRIYGSKIIQKSIVDCSESPDNSRTDAVCHKSLLKLSELERESIELQFNLF